MDSFLNVSAPQQCCCSPPIVGTPRRSRAASTRLLMVACKEAIRLVQEGVKSCSLELVFACDAFGVEHSLILLVSGAPSFGKAFSRRCVGEMRRDCETQHTVVTSEGLEIMELWRVPLQAACRAAPNFEFPHVAKFTLTGSYTLNRGPATR